MFDNKNVEAMANAAREQLKRQQEEVKPTENLYEEMIAEQGGASNFATPPQENDYSIQRESSEYEERPQIRTNPTEADYNDYPEIDEFDKPIFPGGPLMSQINSWKKQYMGYDVYVTQVAEQYFVFRTLNRFEYKQIVGLQNTDPLMREEIICETCTLWPSNYKWDVMATGKAGLPSTYSQIIMEKSGFTKDFAIQVL